MSAHPTAVATPAALDAGADAGRPGPWARLEVAVWRHGWAWPLAGLLVVAALLLEAWQVQGLQRQLAEAQAHAALPRPAAQPDAGAAPAAAKPLASLAALAALTQALGGQPGTGSPAAGGPDTGAAVAQLAALGRRHGIDLAQAQYQASNDAQAGLQRLQITLPAQASYAQARGFLQDLLQALPQATVDQFELKRGHRGEAGLALQLKLSLWQLGPALPAAAAGPLTAASAAAPQGARQ